jgi:hypothetical protein
MIVLDFLFNICFAPFHKAIKGGRLGAIFTLSPSLTFLLCGILNIIFYEFVGPLTSMVSPFVFGAGMLLFFILIYLLLDRIYVKNNRVLWKMHYPILYTLLLPILFIGSIIFFVYSVDKFG